REQLAPELIGAENLGPVVATQCRLRSRGGGRSEIRLATVWAIHGRANGVRPACTKLDTRTAFGHRDVRLPGDDPIHQRVHERHETRCGRERGPRRVEAAADDHNVSRPDEPRLTIDCRKNLICSLLPAPGALQLVAPHDLHAIEYAQVG